MDRRSIMFTIVAWLMCAVCAALATSSRAADEGRTVRALVSIIAPDKAGMPGIPLMLQIDQKTIFADTDASGVATFELEATSEVVTGTVSFADDSLKNRPAEEVAARRRVVYQLAQKYYVPIRDYPRELQSVQVGLNDTSITRIWQLHELISVSGIVTDDRTQAPPKWATAFARYCNGGVAKKNDDGSFVVKGVPRSVANEIYISTSPLIFDFPISREQAQADIALGTLTVHSLDPKESGTMSLKVTEWRGDILDSRGARLAASVTLLSTDGKTVASYFINQDGNAGITTNEKTTLAPVGEYFICPGIFFVSDDLIAIRDYLRNGMDIENVKCPRIEIAAGGTTELSVSASELVDRMNETLTVIDALKSAPKKNE